MKNLKSLALQNGYTNAHDESLKEKPELFIEFFNKLESILTGTFKGLFKRTTKIVLKPTKKIFNVKRDIADILPTIEQGGKIGHLDTNIVEWFGNVTVNGRSKTMVLFLYRLLQKVAHGKIIETGQKFKIYQKCNIFDGIELVAKLIEAGEVDEEGGTHIPLKEKYEGSACRLCVFRLEDGTLGVLVSTVYLGFTLNDGHGIVLH